MENSKDLEKKILDMVAKSDQLKVSINDLELKLKALNEINVMSKRLNVGIGLRQEDSGSITPILLYDNKKSKKSVDPNKLQDEIDSAIENYFNEKV